MIGAVAFSQAIVWQKEISGQEHSIATDPLDNIILFGRNGAGASMQLTSYTKDGLQIWTKKLSRGSSYGTSPTDRSLLTDHNGNIYIFSPGFDSVNSQSTGIRKSGVTKFDPQGNIVWHTEFNVTNSNIPTRLNIGMDADENLYVAFNVGSAGPSPTNIYLGNISIPIISTISSLGVGSLTRDGLPRWVRCFAFANTGGLTNMGSADQLQLVGSKLLVRGKLTNRTLLLDNGITLSTSRCTNWLAGFEGSTGQTIWGKVHNLFYSCAGSSCGCYTTAIQPLPSTGRIILEGGLLGAFLFAPNDTIRTITATGQTTMRNYYTTYDSLGTPIKGDTLPLIFNNQTLWGSRKSYLYTSAGNTFRKLDTAYNIFWQRNFNMLTSGIVYVPITGNDIFFIHGNGYTNWLVKMSDSSGVALGRVYADLDNNGIYTAAADTALSNVYINSGNSSASAISSSDSGKYYLYLTTGSHSVSANFNHPYYQFLPSSYNISIAQFSDSIAGKDFRLRPLFNFTDVAVSISSLSYARPGRPAIYQLTVNNSGVASTPVQVGLKLPALTSYSSAVGATVVVNAADSITLFFNNVNPFETKKATLALNIATFATLNDSLKFYPRAYPYTIDTLKFNNTDTLLQAVRTSFDPNEKEVNFKGQPVADTAKALTYTIHFQNTGNDTAFYVRIVDTLSSRLNPNSFSFIDASHPVTTEIRNNIIQFIFNPILLPDSNTSETQSHGFVKFKFKPATPVNISDTIFNKAAIYFDYNAPVITNNAKTWFYDVTVPVVLQSFVADKLATAVQLKFSTASEQNLDHFLVERSTDGINFFQIGAVRAKGNSSTITSYSFIDLSPGKTTNFYRLKMLDKDDRFAYSWTLAIRYAATIQPMTVFPNPVSGDLYISFKDISAAKIFGCSLSDASGKVVWTSDVNTGLRTTHSINTFALPNGIYFLYISGNNAVYQQKVIVKH